MMTVPNPCKIVKLFRRAHVGLAFLLVFVVNIHKYRWGLWVDIYKMLLEGRKKAKFY